MKSLIVLVVGLMAIGCGKKLTPEEKALRDSVVGEYEQTRENLMIGGTYKSVYLDNGIYESYANGKKQESEFKWSIVDGEIHVKNDAGEITVMRINKDGSLTHYAYIDTDGKRLDYPKEVQTTRKKIK